MNFAETIFLGILQGVTEFFPISSSGHLVLAEHFFNLDVANLKSFDVVLHAGTLLALLILFWREWWGIVIGFWSLVIGAYDEEKRNSQKLFCQLVVATLPAAAVGLLFDDWIDEVTRGENFASIIAVFFLIVAVALFLAEKFGKKNSAKVSWKNVFQMGILQAAALLPGISRSGVTIAAGMFGGLKREVAAKFSFLMLAPATAGAVVLISKKVFDGELSLPPIEFVVVGFLVSAVSSFLFARLLLRLVKKYSLIWFAAYLVLAAAVLLMIR
ncbi:undecaprenyl-diphosphate phosphatase [Candidatus Gracilibacteria bacterium]|nr:undecaprenyl-diphosphate phosphatase [Candidatus Gracilibacteria bacterium]MCF7856402.1 undecaprenyl-diphosphate phosphatase [Candidatus Gracilibacteria bacterium]MCF7896275.1 undecaprenyl-diphosphate phosphatase [Candidatus Gracilibacteria bacterium]